MLLSSSFECHPLIQCLHRRLEVCNLIKNDKIVYITELIIKYMGRGFKCQKKKKAQVSIQSQLCMSFESRYSWHTQPSWHRCFITSIPHILQFIEAVSAVPRTSSNSESTVPNNLHYYGSKMPINFAKTRFPIICVLARSVRKAWIAAFA